MKTTTTILKGNLTTKDLETLTPGTVIAHGTVPNSVDWVYMTNNDIGKMLMWVAIVGYAHEWSIYVHWADKGLHFVKTNGDKIVNSEYITMLVPCSPEALKNYRL